MSNTSNHQFSRNIFLKQTDTARRPQTHGDVGQDKRAFSGARIASTQPAQVTKGGRAQKTAAPAVRSQNRPVTHEPLVKVTLWVKPVVKGELERLTRQQRVTKPDAAISLSATGGAILERAVQQHVDMQYGALLEPVLDKIIDRKMRSFIAHLTWLFVRIAYDTGQTRSLTTNILRRLPDTAVMTDTLFTSIVSGSAEAAKGNITRRTPQMAELIEDVHRWMTSEIGEQNAPQPWQSSKGGTPETDRA